MTSSIRMQCWVVLVTLLSLPIVLSAQGFPFGPRQPKRPDTVLIVHTGKLLAVPGQAPLTEQSVIIRNNTISEVRAGYVAVGEIDAAGAQVELLDLSDKFVLPGLFDAHVHLSLATGSYQTGMRAVNQSPPTGQASVNAFINAQLNLAAGFTTLRDLGSDPESVFAVRDSINNGLVLGPTILASGPSISVSAGHGDDAASSAPGERARAGVCDGVDDCRTLVRHLQKNGSDLIKFKATGGFSSNTGLLQHMTPDEMQSIVQTAHRRGIKVTTHAYDAGAIVDALNAGVDSVEHGFLLDDQGLKLMKRNGAVLVPTLIVAEPPSIAKRFLRGREPSSVTLRNEHRAFERAYEAGVKIVLGTDAGMYPHGKNADELVRMVELGMSPADAIRSATAVAAELFAIEGSTGTVTAGNTADLIAVDSNPLEDIGVLTNVRYVIKAGRVAKRNGVMETPLDFSLEQKY